MRISDWSSDVCSSDLARADLDRYAEALNLLGQDQSPDAMNLRADINWRAKDWLAFARNATQMLGNRYAEPAPLTPEERNRVLKLAVAYSLRSEEHTSELQSLMRISYAVFCLKKKKNTDQ